MKQLLSLLIVFLCFVAVASAQTPAFRWATGAGGGSYDSPSAVAVDAEGNSYVAGTFSSSSITFGPTTLTNSLVGYPDIFLVKYDPSGNVVWAKSAGSSGSEGVEGIAVDASGNIYMAGEFASSTLTFGSTTLTNAMVDFEDMFIVKYDPSGDVLWAKKAGGIYHEYGRGVGLDGAGNVYVSGEFSSISVTFGTTTLTNASSSYDMFIVKYDPSGNVLWAERAGGPNGESITGLAVDASGNSYTTGDYSSATIAFGSDTLINSSSPMSDLFLVKYDAGGNVVWANGAGGAQSDMSSNVAVDDAGNCYMTGNYQSPTITFGATTLTNTGFFSLFLVKYDASGDVLWAKGAGTTDLSISNAVAVDAAGNSYVAGYYSGSTITFGPITLTNAGGYDLFIAKYDAGGNVVWAKRTGGAGIDAATAIAADASGNSFVAGYYYTSTITFGSDTLTNAGNNDIFFVKMDGRPPTLESIRDVPNDQGGKVMLHWTGAGIDKFVQNTSVYSIWRALPSVEERAVSSLQAWKQAKTAGLRVGGKQYRKATLNGVLRYWEWIADQKPHLLPQYAFAAPTLSDSLSPTAPGREYFFVSAETNDPNVFYDSNVDSGYSVDNLVPTAPSGFMANLETGPKVTLSWDIATDPDIGHYDIYRSTVRSFSPSSGSKIGTASMRSYTDGAISPGYSYYYRLVAVDIHGNESGPSSEAAVSLSLTRNYAVSSGWNMVSVPLGTENDATSYLYPTAISQALTYRGSYEVSGSIKHGLGYWVKFDAQQVVPLAGILRMTDTTDIVEGWNMVGSVSDSLPVSSITSVPPGLTTSNFFGFAGSYQSVTSLEPGKGYWVKVSAPGKLILGVSSPTGARITIQPTTERPPLPPREMETRMGLPTEYALNQSYPNPFNPTATIDYELPTISYVKLTVHNILGAEVANLVNGIEQAGYKSVSFNASLLPSGVYYYRLQAGTFTSIKKMVLLK